MSYKTGASASGAIVCAILLAACTGATGSTPDEPVGEAQSASVFDFGGLGNSSGKHDFTNALPGTNGRSCATCHVPEDHFTLTPQHVQALYAQNPNDPLFNPIDSDDPTAAVPTYDHLKAGLVRVTITLADNLDVIDENGNVITNADRTVSVWRGVPSIENVGFTMPYQYDGRETDLPSQADAALHAHSQIASEPSKQVLAHIADFEKGVYSDWRAAEVADAIEDGQTPPPVDLHFPPGSDEAAGQVLFQNVCAQCHGTGTTNVITSQAVNNSFFPVQNADGTVNISGYNAEGVAIPTTFRTDLQFPQHMGTLGVTPIAVLEQIGFLPNPSGLSLPHYRIRFYADATRAQKMVDFPPAGVGPSLFAEPFTTDPGRALITGNPYDWEGFKVLQLRGISKTAPYFHDASAPDLHAVLDEYSRFLLQADPVLKMPGVYPPEAPGLPPEALSPTQKAQLFAFLNQL